MSTPDPVLEPIAATIADTLDTAVANHTGAPVADRQWLTATALAAARAVYLAIAERDWKLIAGERLFQLEQLAGRPTDQETAVLPPERHSPGPTGVHEGSDATEPANDAHRAAETYDLEVLGEALRATGIKVEDVNPRHLREALIETSGPPWGQGRGAYLAGLLGKQFAEDKRREASS